MSSPASDRRPDRQLVWAPAEVLTGIAGQIEPLQARERLRTTIIRSVLLAYVFTWPPAFGVLAAATVAAPTLTDAASVGATAGWALQIATLIALWAAVSALMSHRRAATESADPEVLSRSRLLLRLAGNAARTGALAAVVLALAGLAPGQVAALAGAVAVVLHLLPMLAFRLLTRGRRADPVGEPAERLAGQPVGRPTERPASEPAPPPAATSAGLDG
ncbi:MULTISPECIES: hypothetical protein [unclassified Solwaraspora]|uniref:hypothetical protein n=1 Tax=unclassified Solwaraspora TaxID=2627926 RepID=UPI00259AF046|nr:hypothetical protein [Solwaraspora sp. WMMA2056]WJK42137.1 hypothetical protein O7608_07045 [Solwaraspora sp. WMMA2056]